MTVKELIKELKKHDQNKNIIFVSGGEYVTKFEIHSDNNLRVLIRDNQWD